jgi:hypothetical protein
MFRIRERASLNVRIEFTNVFNRTFMNHPDFDQPADSAGEERAGGTASGFGFIDTTSVNDAAWQGQLVAQFRF